MRMLIKFLVYKLKTIDGNKGTAIPLLDHMIASDIKSFLQKNNRTTISPARESQIRSTNEFKLFSKVFIKYTILSVRQKISFSALIKKKTILELFIDTIQKFYSLLNMNPTEED